MMMPTMQRVLPRAPIPRSLPAPGLPEPVARYLAFTRARQRPPIRTARIAFRGWLRPDDQRRSRFLRSTLELRTDPPARFWSGKLRYGPFWAHGRDSYREGTGRLRVDLFSVLPIHDLRGPELAASGLVTVLAELPLVPTALLPSARLEWAAVDARTARATLRDGSLEVSGIFRFDDRCRIVRFETEDRYRVEHGRFVRTPWHVRYREYVAFGRVHLPLWVTAGWTVDGAESTYADFSITDIAFDV